MNRKKLFDDIMSLIINATYYIHKYESQPRSYGTADTLYPEECHTIDMIGKNEGIGVTEIARRMGKTKSAISQLVDRLVKKELLEKCAHPTSERALILRLTSKGNLVFGYHAEFDKISYGKIMERLEGFSDRELMTYMEIQKEINRCLKKNASKHEIDDD